MHACDGRSPAAQIQQSAGFIQRERAYHDALLDLAAPAMGHPPVVRIAAVDGDGTDAYRRHRASLLDLVR